VAKSAHEFAVNERVNHHVYGYGTISMVDEQHTIIEFDENGRKKFVTSIVQLAHCDVAAPVKAKPRARKAKTTKK